VYKATPPLERVSGWVYLLLRRGLNGISAKSNFEFKEGKRKTKIGPGAFSKKKEASRIDKHDPHLQDIVDGGRMCLTARRGKYLSGRNLEGRRKTAHRGRKRKGQKPLSVENGLPNLKKIGFFRICH